MTGTLFHRLNGARLLIVGVLFAALFLRDDRIVAQDVLKVSPETHAVILENAHVRVLDVRLKPGEEVALHSHPHNVIYYLTDGELRLTSAEGRTEDRTVKAGTAVWSEASVHAAGNLGSSDFHEVQIELKDSGQR